MPGEGAPHYCWMGGVLAPSTDTTLAERGGVPHYCFLRRLDPHCGAKEEDLITPQLWLISCLSTRPHWGRSGEGKGCLVASSAFHALDSPLGLLGWCLLLSWQGWKCCCLAALLSLLDSTLLQDLGWGWKSRCSVHLCWCGWGGLRFVVFEWVLLSKRFLLCSAAPCFVFCVDRTGSGGFFVCLFGPFALPRLSVFSALS